MKKINAALVGGGLALVALMVSSCGLKLPFEPIEDQIIFNVNDAGVGYLDADQILDRWTVNHSSLQWIKLGNSTGEQNDVDRLELFNDPEFPFFEASSELPRFMKPVVIYYDDTDVVIQVGGVSKDIIGSVEYPWDDVEVVAPDSVEFAKSGCVDTAICTKIEYSIPANTAVRLRALPPPSDGFPIKFTLDNSVDLKDVQLGTAITSPSSHSFKIKTRDRHSMAIRVKNDLPEIFIARGGARGKMELADSSAADELFVWHEGKLQNNITKTNLIKAGCPARQSLWYDVNRDGLLDLYIVCGRGASRNHQNERVPNFLFLGKSDGTFYEASEEFNLDFSGRGTLKFLPKSKTTVGGEILWVSDDGIEMLSLRDGTYSSDWRIPEEDLGDKKVAITDFNDDQVLDVFIFSNSGSKLFSLASDGPRFQTLASLGLPSNIIDGGLQDLNGDGNLDLFAVPQGVFLGDGKGFKFVESIDLSWVNERSDARFAIFDYDRDGTEDIWVLAKDSALTFNFIRKLYYHAPKSIKYWMERVMGKESFRFGYWRAKLFLNHQEQMVSTIKFKNSSECQYIYQSPFEIKYTFDAQGDEVTRMFWPGMFDQSRFSQAYFDMPISAPKGYKAEQFKSASQVNSDCVTLI